MKFVVFFLRCLVSLFRQTYRFVSLNPEVVAQVRRESHRGNCLFAIWHQDLFSFITFFYKTELVALASGSQDGEMIARVLEKINYTVVRGSSTRGGVRAIKELIPFLEQGRDAVVTVDGPKGPAKVCKEGIFFMAQKSGAKIVPVSFAPEHLWCFKKSWDRFRLPRPFSTISVCYGEPLDIPRELPREQFPQYCDLLGGTSGKSYCGPPKFLNCSLCHRIAHCVRQKKLSRTP